MSESPSTMNPEPNNQTPSPDHFSKIAFWKVGIIEVLAGAVILLLIFGVLNYFNILPISDVFPNQLGFLPKQQLEINTIPANVIKISPTTAPIYPPAPEFAATETKILLDDVLNDSLVPDSLTFEKQNIENPYGYTFYGTGWEAKSGETFVATMEYNQANVLTDKQIVIHVIPQITEVLNASESSNLVSRYFKQKPEQKFSCIKLPVQNIDSIFCEAFWQDENRVKKGINVNSPILGLQETRIFYCEHTQDSSGYSWKSCDLRYKDTGT